MSGAIRALATFWNEDPDRFVFLLEELGVELKAQGLASPAIVDCRNGALPPRFLLSDAKSERVRGLKGVARGEVPFVKAAETDLLSKSAVSPGTRLYFALADEESASRVRASIDDVFVVVRPTSESTSFLFALARNNPSTEGRYPRYHVLVSGVPKIEDAAAFFVSLRDELLKVNMGQAEYLFAGFYDIDLAKIEIARSCRVPYRDVFKGDSFYGQLAYAARHLSDRVERVETDLPLSGFFGALAPSSPSARNR
ncbi:MAG TPA: hypothetical protein PKO22_10095 [Treponemataceae bacterium]|jgi:hypothetical protein|nr:hypothetical protein [Treponemataceae bacterium]